MKTLDKNLGIRFDKDFLDLTLKVQVTKDKIDILNFVKI